MDYVEFIKNLYRQGTPQEIATINKELVRLAVSGTPGNLMRINATGNGLEDTGSAIGLKAYDVPDIITVYAIVNSALTSLPNLPDVAFSTTSNDTLTGLAARDGFTPTAGLVALVKDNTNKAKNGFWITAAGAWSRASLVNDAWVPVTTETTYAALGYDEGIVNVTGGNTNRNLQFQVSINATDLALDATAATVTVTATTRLPVGDSHNPHVNRNRGNDTNNSGNPAYPVGTVSRALSTAQFPAFVNIAVSDGAYSESVTIPPGATEVTFASADHATGSRNVSWSGTWFANLDTQAKPPALTWKGISFTNATPFLITGTTAGKHALQDCKFISSTSNIAPTPIAFIGTLTVRNVDVTGAPNAAIGISSTGGTFNFEDQISPLPIALLAAITGSGVTINIRPGCAAGMVRVPLTFAGTVNRQQAAPTSVAGVISNQAALDALLANAALESSGFYLITGFVPTQSAALAGAIVGHEGTGLVAKNWLERSFADAPPNIATATSQIYNKAPAPTYWGVLAPSQIGVISETLTVTGTVLSPVLTPAFINSINVVDNGSGWCELVLMVNKPAGGQNGSGDMLIKLPGGLKFDLGFHGAYAFPGDPLMNGLSSWIPGSSGIIENQNIRQNCYAAVWDATRFRVLIGGEGLYSSVSAVRYPWGSAFFSPADRLCLQLAFRFKKG